MHAMSIVKSAIFGIAAAAAVSVTPALAGPVGTPVTVVDPTLNPFALDGQVQIVFTFSDASNEDLILTTPTLNGNPIIDNHTTAKGTVINLGNFTGNLVFQLDNLKTGATYFSDALDAFGDYHVKLDTNYADFGVPPLSGAALANITNLANQGYAIIFMAWEDHDKGTKYPGVKGSDFDYNDVIFAIAYKVNQRTIVPEPLTLSLFGAGLVGAAALRRRKKKSA